jgi:hypothetical protein
MLLLGHSIAVEKGMLDVTHTHLFTFRSHQGAAATEPRPYSAQSKGLFSYQSFSRASDLPTVDDLVQEPISVSDALKAELLESAA